MKSNYDKTNEVFNELYKEMFPKLKFYAANLLNSEALAEEAVQETFIVAYKKFDEFMNSPNSRGWLMNTLKYTINNTRRDIFQTNKLLSEYLELDENTMGSKCDEINPLLLYGGKLTDDELILLNKIAVDKKSYLEISRELNISVDACKKRAQRAKEKFIKSYSHD